MDKLNHWRYFLSLEREVEQAFRFVEYSDRQKDVYSFEFARLLLLTCAELDVVFKVACKAISGGEDHSSIGEYYSRLIGKYQIRSEIVRIDRISEELQPFREWEENSPPCWWTAHNKVKHRRHEHFQLASFSNVLSGIAGLLVANLILMSEFNVIEGVNDRLCLLGRDSEPGAIMTQASYRVRTIWD